MASGTPSSFMSSSMTRPSSAPLLETCPTTVGSAVTPSLFEVPVSFNSSSELTVGGWFPLANSSNEIELHWP